MRARGLFGILLALLLAACGPAVGATSPQPSQAAPTETPAPGVTAVTAVAGTAVAGTAVVVTSFPSNGTPPPIPTPLPATPIPTLPAGLGPTTLKYRLLDAYPDLFYCDPDYYPVARANETDLAVERFSQLQANPEEFQAILSRLGLSGSSNFTGEQKLQVYREHKRLAAVRFTLAGDSYQFQLQIKESSGQGYMITGLINGAGTVTVQARQPSIATCPICLAAHTLIATPQGPVPVEDLQAGDLVWTVDSRGTRLVAPILKTVEVPSPPGHQVMHLALDDGLQSWRFGPGQQSWRFGPGRQLWASPGHPTADGRFIGQLRPGDWLDGGRVTLAELVPYGGPATYDILPAGATGFYWADGILVGSTLKHP